MKRSLVTRALVRNLFFVLPLISALMLASGCSSNKPKPEEDSSVPNASAADENLSGDSDNGKAMGLQTVNFEFDSFTLTSDSKEKLKTNAQILKSSANVKIQIEGHCDQMGGIQYNIALGEKRANATKNYLVDQGVRADRIATISFGKERPIDPGSSESANAKNRRANFVITAQ